MDRSIHHPPYSEIQLQPSNSSIPVKHFEVLGQTNEEEWGQKQQAIENQLDEVPKEDSSKLMTIFRLPAWYHETNKHLYEPKMVSIGPYHRDKVSLKAMHEDKLRSLRDFVKSGNVPFGVYFRAVRDLEIKARDCYNETVRMESPAFVTMLLLDACFIIDYFQKFQNPQNAGTVCNVGWANIYLYSDLFLLENQIPFFVIHKLLTIKHNRNEYCENPCPLLELFNTPLNLIFSTKKLTTSLSCNPIKIHHLLDFYYKSMLPHDAQSDHDAPQRFEHTIPIQKSRCCWPGRLHWRKLDHNKAASGDHDQGENISCVTELREAGVTFKKKKDPKDMFDISFKNGVMEIPFLKVDDTHKIILWNMVAFEQSRIHSNKSQILSSYLALMDSLINTAKDVAELEKHGIVENYLQSNEDAAELFNQFAKSYVLDYSKHYYQQLFQDVKKYSRSVWHRNRARLKHDYFQNPWTTISVLAAAVLLILTGAQTFFSYVSTYN